MGREKRVGRYRELAGAWAECALAGLQGIQEAVSPGQSRGP